MPWNFILATMFPSHADLYGNTGPKPYMDPVPEVTSTLFHHQKEALAWMLERENSNALPPFWSAAVMPGSRNILYTNTLAHHETTVRPQPIRWVPWGRALTGLMRGFGEGLWHFWRLVQVHQPGESAEEKSGVCHAVLE